MTLKFEIWSFSEFWKMPSNRDRNDVTLRLSRFNQPNKMTSGLTLSHFQTLLRFTLISKKIGINKWEWSYQILLGKNRLDFWSLTPTLSEFESFNNTTLIIQNWLVTRQKSFINLILLKNILKNFDILRKNWLLRLL